MDWNHLLVLDAAGLQDFREGLADHATTIEREVARLKRNPAEPMPLVELFRAFHNIKGDAALCRVEWAVELAHPIESVLARLRSGELLFSELLGEAILLAVDRMEMAVEALLQRKPLESLRLAALLQALQRLAAQTAGQMDLAAAGLIEAVTGFRPTQVSLPSRGGSVIPKSAERVAEDLRFFRSLALQLESRSPLLRGRTARNLRLAQDTNREAGNLIDPVQLEAAVYIHDIGMMFLPESVWLKVERLTDADRQALHTHPGFAAEWLARVEGWQDAAQMVLQHHEMPDGAGYPNRLPHEAICNGARLLAIVDAFEAVMQKHRHRGQNRSALRAIAEINACDNQFAPEWIGPFNQVIRRALEA
ncbi:HD domain-containing phosphohydrolase [Leeia aquatica]|uniref:HD domain-containing phosphohydrolase n=1 Tax=Leeia aquatica TaxID=2725557 RepID=UPI001981CF2A|nr:HD domain-containing phosphohydrolase [Leeia aquatica]